MLDAAAEHIATAMQAISEAQDAIRAAGIDPEREEEALHDARNWMGQAMAAQKWIWTTVNRLSIRKGPSHPAAQALEAAERAIGMLGGNVRRRLVHRDLPDYDEAWAKAQNAEKAFYAAAEAELRATEARGG